MYQSHCRPNGLPAADEKLDGDCMEETEVITRMLQVLHNYAIYDLKTLDWSRDFADQGIDSLESTALLTSFEHEFHTIFEDNVFEHFSTFNEVKDFLASDHNAF